MPKRPREHFFRNPARRPRTGPIGLDSLPPTLIEQVLSYVYPEGCLEFMHKRQLQRMAERMFEGFAHNHQVMVFGRQALDVLTASGSLRDGMWHYRERLETFQSALHCRFVDYCRWQLSEQSTGQAGALRGPGAHTGAGAAPTKGPVLRPELLRRSSPGGGRP